MADVELKPVEGNPFAGSVAPVVPAAQIESMVVRIAKEQGVDPNLALRIARQESRFNPAAVSDKGARGVMQLMPDTAKELGVTDLHDPEQNIRGGVKYLAQLDKQFGGDEEKVRAAYHSGPGTVEKGGLEALGPKGRDYLEKTAPKNGKRGPVFPLEGEKKPAVSLVPVEGDPFAEPDTGTKASDYGKSAAAGVMSGTGMIAQGGGELVSRGINLVGEKLGFDPQLRAINPMQGWINDILDSRTPAAKKAEADTQISGELLKPETWDFGADPSIKGLALQGLNAIGQFAPNLGIALVTAGASIPSQLAIGATVGGLQALGGGAQDEREAIGKMTHQQLIEGSKLYATLIEKGVPQGQAKEAVAEAAALGGGLGNAIPSAAEGAFENFLIGALTRGKIRLPSLGAGVAGRVASGTAGGALMGGSEEAAEQVGQNIGSNIAIGGNRPLGADTLQQFVMGALAEGAAGGGAGVLSKGPPTAPQPVPSAPGGPAGQPEQPLTPIDQARADAQVLKSGGDLPGADETRLRNATLVSVYGENAAVRHVVDGGPQFSAIGDAMLLAAPTVERVRGTIQSGSESRDITNDILGAVDELAKIKASGQTVAQVMAQGISHDISYEGQKLMQFLDENAGNSKRIASFLEAYLHEVETATGVPSKVRGRAFDIIEEQRLSRKKADEEAAIAQKKTEEAVKEVREKVSEPKTAMEVAFSQAKPLKEKKNAKPSTGSDGAVQSAKTGNFAPRTRKDEGEPKNDSGAVPVPSQTNQVSNARSIREASDQRGTQESVNRGSQITAERQAKLGTGERTNPVQASTPKHIATAAARAETLPSPAQIEADNARKGHFEFAEGNPLRALGVISIETAKGVKRVSKDGKWTSPALPNHYGHLQIAKGADGDKADITVGDDLNAKEVYVIDQINPETGKFDETKSFAGFPSEKAARTAYLSSFSDNAGQRIGAITAMPVEQYIQLARSDNLDKPVAAPPATAPARPPSLTAAMPAVAALKLEDIPESMKITLPVLVEETGETVMVEQNARKAFKSADQRVNRLVSLRDCLRAA